MSDLGVQESDGCVFQLGGKDQQLCDVGHNAVQTRGIKNVFAFGDDGIHQRH